MGEQQRKQRGLADATVVMALFACALCVGMTYVSTWGGTGYFYQRLFGPALMFACGRGYVNPDVQQVPALQDFLYVEEEFNARRPPDVDRFDPEDLPQDVPNAPFNAIQRRQLYLLGSAALLWRVLGVAWSALTPLFGLLFAASVIAAYGLFRLGMGRTLATACAVMFMTSPLHLQYLPDLRDYAKAPFILAAVFLTGCLVRFPMSRRGVWIICALCGLVIGIGVGFRVDVLIAAPPLALACLFLLPKEGTCSMPARVGALGVFAVAFVVAAFPILTQLGEGGNKSHPTLLGFMEPYSQRLGVGGAPYQFGNHYLDTEALTIVNAFGRPSNTRLDAFIYEKPRYERTADALLTRFVRTFPADVLIRAYAAVLRVLDELRGGARPGPPGVTSGAVLALYRARQFVEGHVLVYTRYMVLAALCLIAGRRLMLGFGVLLATLYFAGYSAVQYGSRNCFHLEVIPWWFTGFMIAHVVPALQSAWASRRDPRAHLRTLVANAAGPAKRVAIFAMTATLGLCLPLWGLRWYQEARVKALFSAYEAAPRLPVAWEARPGDDGTDLLVPAGIPECPAGESFEWQMLVAEVAPCDRALTMRVRYASDCRESDISWETTLAPADAVTTVFIPIYAGHWTEYAPQWTCFTGLQIAHEDLPCLTGLFRADESADFPLLVKAVLPTHWESMPLCQRLTR